MYLKLPVCLLIMYLNLLQQYNYGENCLLIMYLKFVCLFVNYVLESATTVQLWGITINDFPIAILYGDLGITARDTGITAGDIFFCDCDCGGQSQKNSSPVSFSWGPALPCSDLML